MEAITSNFRDIMALQIAKFAATNKISEFQTSLSTSELLVAKSSKSFQLIIDFTRYTIPIVSDLLSDLWKHLKIFPSDYQRTKDIKIKRINQDVKNNQQVFIFFSLGIDMSKTRIHQEQ